MNKEDYTKFAYSNADAFLKKFWNGAGEGDPSLGVVNMRNDGLVVFTVDIEGCDTFFTHSVHEDKFISWCNTLKLANWVNKNRKYSNE